ncbi:MAG TPA: hypothetical protein VHU19_13740 [Pyrinomonadaceae bacterium]|nr:hypothetical protein [Pyrinomonadaceae bacterium]
MGVWLFTAALFFAWLVCVLVFNKGGFIHILLLSAISTAVVQFLQDRRAAKR